MYAHSLSSLFYPLKTIGRLSKAHNFLTVFNQRTLFKILIILLWTPENNYPFYSAPSQAGPLRSRNPLCTPLCTPKGRGRSEHVLGPDYISRAGPVSRDGPARATTKFLASTILAESWCFENGAKRRMFQFYLLCKLLKIFTEF